jgi:glycosyltransferase involved in cell wall biosynthesis
MMAEALKKLLTEPDLRKKFGDAGRRRMEQYFSKEKLIRNMDDFYQEIVREKSGRNVL